MTKILILFFTMIVSFLTCQAKEKVLFTLDFEEMETGAVADTEGWYAQEGSVVVKEMPDVGKVISSDGKDDGERHDLVFFCKDHPFGIKKGSRIAVEFDVWVKSGYGTALLGIGDAFQNPPLVMGVLSADLFTRAYADHEMQKKARGRNSEPVAIPGNQWHRLRFVLDLKAGEGVMGIKNLERGDTDFKIVYFDKEQIQTRFPLGLDSPHNSGAENWNGLYFRFQRFEGAINSVRIIQL